MGFVADSVEVITSFDLAAGGTAVEVSEFTLWGTLVNIPSDPEDWNLTLLTIAQQTVDAWGADMDTTPFPQAMTLHGAKARRVSAAGLTLAEQAAVPSGTAWAGTDPNSMPWEVAVAMSLYSYTPGTFIPHGRRRRGRCYLGPMGTSNIQGDGPGYIKTAVVTALLGEFKAFLHDGPGMGFVAGAPNQLDLGVFSRMDSHIYGLTDLRCNNKFDSQRRREKSLSQTWQTVSY